MTAMNSQPAVQDATAGLRPAELASRELPEASASRLVELQRTPSADDKLDPGQSFLVALGASILVWVVAIALLRLLFI
jgi:hypothetical protein